MSALAAWAGMALCGIVAIFIAGLWGMGVEREDTAPKNRVRFLASVAAFVAAILIARFV